MTASPPGGRDRVRRRAVAAAMLALFLVALAVFVLPFAFPTPPPIVTRFGSTRLFSPPRDVARINLRLHEPSVVTVEIQRGGTTIVPVIAQKRLGAGYTSLQWFGRDSSGAVLPDGTYGIKLRARSGAKRFEKSRRIVIDTVPPRPGTFGVVSATLGEPGPGECRVTLTSPDAAEATLRVRAAAGGATLRRLGPRPVRAGATLEWSWGGRTADGAEVPPGLYTIESTLSDAAGNRTTDQRTCWVGRLAGTALPAHPRPGGLVGVRLRRTDGTPLPGSTAIVLTLHRRTGTPGANLGDPLGPRVAGVATGPAGRVRLRLPRRISTRALWLAARTRDGRAVALVRLR